MKTQAPIVLHIFLLLIIMPPAWAGFPVLTMLQPVPSPSNDLSPTFVFHSTEAGTLMVAGDCGIAKKMVDKGNNTVHIPYLSPGNHFNCSVRVKNRAGLLSKPLSLGNIQVLYEPDAKASISMSWQDTYGSEIWNFLEVVTLDSRGQVISRQYTEKMATKLFSRESILNSYDTHGNLLQRVDRIKGAVLFTHDNYYDARGNLARMTRRYPDGYIEDYSLTWDLQGNLVKLNNGLPNYTHDLNRHTSAYSLGGIDLGLTKEGSATWNAAGWLVSEAYKEQSCGIDCSGSMIYHTLSYDPNARLKHLVSDQGPGANIKYYAFLYTQDSKIPYQIVRDWGGMGECCSTTTMSVTAKGNAAIIQKYFVSKYATTCSEDWSEMNFMVCR